MDLNSRPRSKLIFAVSVSPWRMVVLMVGPVMVKLAALRSGAPPGSLVFLADQCSQRDKTQAKGQHFHDGSPLSRS